MCIRCSRLAGRWPTCRVPPRRSGKRCQVAGKLWGRRCPGGPPTRSPDRCSRRRAARSQPERGTCPVSGLSGRQIRGARRLPASQPSPLQRPGRPARANTGDGQAPARAGGSRVDRRHGPTRGRERARRVRLQVRGTLTRHSSSGCCQTTSPSGGPSPSANGVTTVTSLSRERRLPSPGTRSAGGRHASSPFGVLVDLVTPRLRGITRHRTLAGPPAPSSRPDQ